MNQNSSTLQAYALTETEFGNTFTTDSGEEYLIYFSEAVNYFPGLKVGQYASMVGFTRPKVHADHEHKSEHKNSKDARIKATVIDAIRRFLDDDRNVLTYCCESTNKRSAGARHKLFEEWFEELNAPNLIRRVASASNDLYACFIYSRTNPFVQELEECLPTMDEKITHIASQPIE
jgi:hypothetical protein